MLVNEISRTYRPSPVAAHNLEYLLTRSSDVDLKSQDRFLFLEPVANNMIPLLTLKTSDDWVHFRAYVLLAMLDQDNELQALAIRFETDEGERQTNGTIGSHDFCHAQLCRSIGAKRATTEDWLPESQPSFPLDARDQVGLVLCMLTSLYGGRHVVRQFPGDKHLRKHLDKVRALASNDCSKSTD